MRKIVITLGMLLFTITLFAQSNEDALVAFREGRFQDAIRITTEEIRNNPNNMDAYTVQGWSLLSLGRWTATIDSAQKALEISPYDHRIIGIMAEAQYGLGNYLTALQYLQEYASVRPSGSIIDYIYQLMGEIHISFEEFHLADIAFSTSLAFNPSNAQNWLRLGFAREQAGDSIFALEAYQRALSLDASLSEAQEAVARLQNG